MPNFAIKPWGQLPIEIARDGCREGGGNSGKELGKKSTKRGKEEEGLFVCHGSGIYLKSPYSWERPGKNHSVQNAHQKDSRGTQF